MQLFVVLSLLLIWSFGTFIIWYKANRTLAARNQPHGVPQTYKAVVVLAQAIQSELKHIQDDHGIHSIEDFTSGEIHAAIDTQLRGGRIYLSLGDQNEIYGIWRGIFRWIKNLGSRIRLYWIWYGVMTLLSVCIAVGWRGGVSPSHSYTLTKQFKLWLWYTSMCAFLPMIFGLRIASTTRSRVAFCLFGLIFGCICALAIILGVLKGHSYYYYYY